MAIMINCARDWTYDLYLEDIKAYGEGDASYGDDYREYFAGYVKRAAEKFMKKWKEEHDGKLYDHGYVGDAFAADLYEWFSDFYKDAYSQRPHLPVWFYVHPLGLPMEEDVSRTFCAHPMEEAANNARATRQSI